MLDRHAGLRSFAPEAERQRERWRSLGQPWRTEPEIDGERQRFLGERRVSGADPWRRVYPFAGIRLTRADVEWLIATLPDADDAGRSGGQVQGLDVRGADLRGVDLRRLHLHGLCGGLSHNDWTLATDDQREAAAVRLDRADLRDAHLVGAILDGASLVRARLSQAHLEGADLSHATLQGASLATAALTAADLHEAHLEGADLTGADLRGATLRNAHLEDARLRGARLGGERLTEEALRHICFWCPGMPATIPPADLRGATFNTGTDLFGIVLGDPVYGFVRVADLRWGDAIATVIDWAGITMLGDEREARAPVDADGKPKARAARIGEYETAIRANRQLAIVLQAQGLSDQAGRLNYRAQLLRRELLRWQLVWGEGESEAPGAPRLGWWRRVHAGFAYALSLLLDLVSGYGSKVERCFLTYLAVVLFFTATHLAVGMATHQPLSVLDALAMTIQSLHGRNFAFLPTGPQVAVNTAEAVVGLIVEALVVAVITRRILGLG